MPHIVNRPWSNPAAALKRVPLFVERATLAKRRWHAVAVDGADFGFDLEDHLHDGDVIFETATAQYCIAQKPEALLELELGDVAEAARRAWSLGNLHFPIEITRAAIRVIDDPAVRLFFERENIPFRPVTEIFHPCRATAGHSHGHAH